MNRTQGSFHDVMVTCVASGSPMPIMAWRRRGDATGNDPIQVMHQVIPDSIDVVSCAHLLLYHRFHRSGHSLTLYIKDILLVYPPRLSPQSRGRFVVTEDQRDGVAVLTLVIKHATQEDQGIYICSATNKKASVRQQFEFDILGMYCPL